MSAIFGTPAKEGDLTRLRASGLIAPVKAWWMAYLTRCIERAAIIQLRVLSDRVLLDIGLTRSQIEEAVKGELIQGKGMRPRCKSAGARCKPRPTWFRSNPFTKHWDAASRPLRARLATTMDVLAERVLTRN